MRSLIVLEALFKRYQLGLMEQHELYMVEEELGSGERGQNRIEEKILRRREHQIDIDFGGRDETEMIYKVNSKGKSIYDIIVDGVPFDGDPLPNPLLNGPIRRSLLKLKQKKKKT